MCVLSIKWPYEKNLEIYRMHLVTDIVCACSRICMNGGEYYHWSSY